MIKSIKDMISDFKSASTVRKIHLIGTLLLSVVIVATAICFILCCTTIFFTGGASPFSREIVAEYFTRIAPITFICLGLTVAVGITSLCVKEKEPKRIPISKRTLLKITAGKLSGYSHSDEYNEAQRCEVKWRRIVFISAASLCAVFAAVAFIFILNPARYVSDDFNTDIAYSVLIGLAATVASFATCYVASMLLDSSYVRQTEAARTELGRAKAGELTELEIDEEIKRLSLNDGHAKLILRAAVFVISLTFVIIGIFNGGMADVLGKAVRICTECIGLG